jgi:hypothetical protein
MKAGTKASRTSRTAAARENRRIATARIVEVPIQAIVPQVEIHMWMAIA